MLCGNKKDIEKLLPYVAESLQKALQYICETDFTKVPNGEYEIDGRNVFARVNTYATEAMELKKPESHNEYIDVQYLGAGAEIIYFEPKRDTHIVVEDYAEESDLLFYAPIEESGKVILRAGDFAVFFPWELHRSGCNVFDAEEQVQKIVVKVKR